MRKFIMVGAVGACMLTAAGSVFAHNTGYYLSPSAHINGNGIYPGVGVGMRTSHYDYGIDGVYRYHGASNITGPDADYRNGHWYELILNAYIHRLASINEKWSFMYGLDFDYTYHHETSSKYNTTANGLGVAATVGPTLDVAKNASLDVLVSLARYNRGFHQRNGNSEGFTLLNSVIVKFLYYF